MLIFLWKCLQNIGYGGLYTSGWKKVVGVYQHCCNTLLFLQPPKVWVLSCCSVVCCSNSKVTREWQNPVAVFKNCTDVLRGRDQIFGLCVCMTWWGLDQVCSSHSLSPCVAFVFVVPRGQIQVWLLLCYVLYNSPCWSLPYGADNLKETVWQVRWNDPTSVLLVSLPVRDSLPVCSSTARFSSGILKLYTYSHWWCLGYLTQKNPQDLALMWLSDSAANKSPFLGVLGCF